jgi:hypothetical protein
VTSAIDFFNVGSFQVNSNGDVIIAETTNRNIILDSSVTQGPFTLNVRFDDFAQLANGLGYSLNVCNTQFLPIIGIIKYKLTGRLLN